MQIALCFYRKDIAQKEFSCCILSHMRNQRQRFKSFSIITWIGSMIYESWARNLSKPSIETSYTSRFNLSWYNFPNHWISYHKSKIIKETKQYFIGLIYFSCSNLIYEVILSIIMYLHLGYLFVFFCPPILQSNMRWFQR